MFRTVVALLLLTVAVATGQPVQWAVEDGGNGHWYLLVTSAEPISWNEANAEVVALDYGLGQGHLVTLTSQAESDWILATFEMQGLGRWTGGIEVEDGVWSWITGEAFEFTNWCSGEPSDSGGNEDRIAIVNSWPRCPGAWNDANQNDRSGGYVVEWEEAPVDANYQSFGSAKELFH